MAGSGGEDADSRGEPGAARPGLAAAFKANDIRGVVPVEIDESLARLVGRAFVAELGARRVIVGHDMRPTSPALAGAFAQGATEAGADVVMIGLASTDQLYYASGRFDLPAAMVTASHNPGDHNGIKLCGPGAVPIGTESGLDQVRDRVLAGAPLRPDVLPGDVESGDVLEEYAAHLTALAHVTGRRLRVVVDAGNGMAGHTAPPVFGRIADRVELVPMYFELDGTFPNHAANPLDESTLVALRDRVVAEQADAGLAFDGDADRCFLIDERGETVPPSVLIGLVASRELARHPGARIVHTVTTSRAVPELVTELGGVPVRARVGHAYLKQAMARTGAVFGGEHSGHYYFREFWSADSGMLAALHVLAALAETSRPTSEVLAEYARYVPSGELNTAVSDRAGVISRLEGAYAAQDGVSVDRFDGLTVTHVDWTFNVRPSNTESLLRLNVEGRDVATMTRVRDGVLAEIRKGEDR